MRDGEYVEKKKVEFADRVITRGVSKGK